MIEHYEGWNIITDREPYTNIITKQFKYGNHKWLQADIYENVNDGKYYIDINGSDPFNFKDRISLRSTDYHSLCNEANDELRALFTQTHEYLIQCINQLPEI